LSAFDVSRAMLPERRALDCQAFHSTKLTRRAPWRPSSARRSLARRMTSFISTRPRCFATPRPYIVGMTKLIVWHDGGCPLCRREIAFMRRLDRRGAIDFVDVTQAPPAACPIAPADMLARFHASEDGRLLSGAAAFAAMWRAIPLLRPIGLAARSPWVLARLEQLYVIFLRFRPRLQRMLADRGGA